MSPSSDDVEDHRQQNAQQDGSRQREIEGRTLAAINNVAGEVSQRQIHSAQSSRYQSRDQQDRTKKDEYFAEVSHELESQLGFDRPSVTAV